MVYPKLELISKYNDESSTPNSNELCNIAVIPKGSLSSHTRNIIIHHEENTNRPEHKEQTLVLSA